MLAEEIAEIRYILAGFRYRLIPDGRVGCGLDQGYAVRAQCGALLTSVWRGRCETAGQPEYANRSDLVQDGTDALYAVVLYRAPRGSWHTL